LIQRVLGKRRRPGALEAREVLPPSVDSRNRSKDKTVGIGRVDARRGRPAPIGRRGARREARPVPGVVGTERAVPRARATAA